MRKALLLMVLVLYLFPLRGQNNVMDSLKQALKNATHDTTRCKILNEMVERETDDNVWPKYNVSLELKALYNLRKYPKGHPFHNFYLRYFAAAVNNIGYLYNLKGDVFHSLEYYYRALKMQREINDLKGEATTFNNLGSVFDDQGEHEKAFEYYRKSYAIQQQVKDLPGMSISLLNIGFYYDNKGLNREALDYYLRSLELSQRINDVQGQVYTMNNISLTYLDFHEIDKSMRYARWALALSQQSDYSDGVAFSYKCMGSAYLEMNEVEKAKECAIKSYEIGKELGFPNTIKEAAELLSEVYEKLGEDKLALKYYKIHVQMRDSVDNEQNEKLSIKKQFQIEYAKKVATDSVKLAEEKKIADATFEARQQKERTVRFSLYGGLALVIVFAAFMFNRFRVTKKQSRLIAIKEREAQHQKNLVVRKQKEIIDSINYAKHIQSAILAREEEIRKYFPESFLLYKPKDIVAGDFYFFETTDTHVFYAAADCTGHGVPGALVSVVCSNALMRCVKEFGLSDPGQILDKTRELVVETFRKSGQSVKDGMDISLISLRFDGLKFEVKTGTSNLEHQTSNKNNQSSANIELSWAGANNPLWIIRKNGTAALTTIRADKQPIGFSEHPRPFTTHRLSLEQGCSIYLFTDGFADQFGLSAEARSRAEEVIKNPKSTAEEINLAKASLRKGKKFKYKKLARLLREQVDIPMKEQAGMLDTTFEQWRGELEQVDDVCVIGIRL